MQREEDRDRPHHRQPRPAVRRSLLPPAEATWDWEIAPFGEIGRRHRLIHRVHGYHRLDGRRGADAAPRKRPSRLPGTALYGDHPRMLAHSVGASAAGRGRPTLVRGDALEARAPTAAGLGGRRLLGGRPPAPGAAGRLGRGAAGRAGAIRKAGRPVGSSASATGARLAAALAARRGLARRGCLAAGRTSGRASWRFSERGALAAPVLVATLVARALS
ncbi:hypothetical protein ACU4GR_21315 [Methylobacterium oryzae CBMB20]